MEFPSTTMTTATPNGDDGDKKPGSERTIKAATAPPSPIGTRLAPARPEPGEISKHSSSSEEVDEGAVNLVAKKMPPLASTVSSSFPKENPHAYHENLAASTALKHTSSVKTSYEDEKAKARNDGMKALEFQTNQAARRRSGTPDECSKSSTAPLPPRRDASNGVQENLDALAKRRARAPPHANVRKLAPPPKVSASPHKIAAATTVSEGEDRDAMIKRQARAPASSTARKVPPPTTLSNTTKSKGGEDRDAMIKRQARAPASSTARKVPPPTTLANTTKSKGGEDRDAMIKRQARAPISGTARKMPPTTTLATSSSNYNVATANTSKGGEDGDAMIKRQARGFVSGNARKMPPATALATNSNGGEDGDAMIKRQARAPVSSTVRKMPPTTTLATSSSNYNVAAVNTGKGGEDRDAMIKRQARGLVSGTAHKTPPTITLANATNSNGGEDGDAMIKRQARAPVSSTVRKMPPTTTLATSSSNYNVATTNTGKGGEDPDAMIKRQARATSSNRQQSEAQLARLKAVSLLMEEEDSYNNGDGEAEAGLPIMMGNYDVKCKVLANGSSKGTAQNFTSFRCEEEHAATKQKARMSSAESGQGVAVRPASGNEDNLHSGFAGGTNAGAYSVVDKVEDNYGKDANAGGGDELEAQAETGVPVVAPGAFRMSGFDAGASDEDHHGIDTDFPSSAESFVAESETSPQPIFHDPTDPTLTDPTSNLFMDPQVASEAQHNPEDAANAVDAFISPDEAINVQAIEDNVDEGWSKKFRFRCLSVGFCLVIAITAVMFAVIQLRAKNSRSAREEFFIPVIEGWNQVGIDLTGPTDDDKSLFGYDVAMDGQAHRVAVGVPGRDHGETELLVGEVHVLDWNGTSWIAHQPIFGPGPESQAGSAVAMSTDGKRVAVGSPQFAPSGGHVAVYEEVRPKQWGIVGQVLVGDIFKEHLDERFGSSLALSADGTILAVGAKMGDGTRGVDMGYVKVFQLQNSTQAPKEDTGFQQQWIQLGNTIYGEKPGDFFGWSLDISSSGERVVAGAIGSFGGSVGEFTGRVRAFDFDRETENWSQVGPAITGGAAFERFGSSVSMCGDGSKIAIGAIGHSKNGGGIDIGHVQVFEFTDTPAGPSWQAFGQTLVGQSAFDAFGYSVSLAEDGKTIAAGGPRNEEFAESSGQIQVFKFDETTLQWNRRGSNIGGSYEGRDLFGWAVSLSSDGKRVAGGAPFSTFDGRLTSVGTVRIYDAA